MRFAFLCVVLAPGAFFLNPWFGAALWAWALLRLAGPLVVWALR